MTWGKTEGTQSRLSGPLTGFLAENKRINTDKKQIYNCLPVMNWSLRILEYLLGVHYSLFIPAIHLSLERLSFGKGKSIFQGVHIDQCIPQYNTNTPSCRQNGGHVLVQFFFKYSILKGSIDLFQEGVAIILRVTRDNSWLAKAIANTYIRLTLGCLVSIVCELLTCQ